MSVLLRKETILLESQESVTLHARPWVAQLAASKKPLVLSPELLDYFSSYRIAAAYIAEALSQAKLAGLEVQYPEPWFPSELFAILSTSALNAGPRGTVALDAAPISQRFWRIRAEKLKPLDAAVLEGADSFRDTTAAQILNNYVGRWVLFIEKRGRQWLCTIEGHAGRYLISERNFV